MSYSMRKVTVVKLLFAATLAVSGCESGYRIVQQHPLEPTNERSSPKGQWGKIVPIADNNHPNLYYNQREIDELRNMVLVQHSPALLWNLWNSHIKGAYAIGPSSNDTPDHNNMMAALSYMLEPTDAKANAIRSALLGFMNVFPNGGGTNNGWWPSNCDVWWCNGGKTQGWGFSGYSVPWLYDLLMAYHPHKLSASEVSALKNWFHITAGVAHKDNWSIYTPSNDPAKIISKEGKTIAGFANWWTRYLSNGFAAALMSGNQDDVDYWFDSGWPHDKLLYDESWIPVPGQHQFDMAMYLLAVFPSGANNDSYDREGYGYGGDSNGWYTTSYSRGIYHFAQMYGIIMAAEAAYHNGMTRVFEISDAGSEPALLRTFKRAIKSRTEKDYNPCYAKYGANECQVLNNFGHPIIGWDPIMYAGYRRYADPILEEAIPDLITDPSNRLASFFSYELAPQYLPFFGYPRHVAWSNGGFRSPLSSSPTVPRNLGSGF